MRFVRTEENCFSTGVQVEENKAEPLAVGEGFADLLLPSVVDFAINETARGALSLYLGCAALSESTKRRTG